MASIESSIREMQVRYAYDPAAWAEDIIGFTPDVWQREAMDRFINDRFLAIGTGTGVGKTAWLAVMILFFLSTRPFPKVPCTAPSQHQLFDQLWAEIAKWQRKSEYLQKLFKWTQTKVSMKDHPEEWFAVARTSRPQPGQDSAVGLQGFHADHILMIVDEASGVADQVMNAVDGAVTTAGAHVIMTGNPNRRSGYFYRALVDKRLHIEHDGPFRTINVDCRDAKHCDPIHIERAYKIYGEDSDFFRVKVKGVPPLAEHSSLITPEQMFEAHIREPNKTGPTVLSIDPARYGDDPTVMLLRQGMTFTKRVSLRSMDTMQVAKVAMDIIDEAEPDFICVDTIGIGSGVADKLRADLAKRGWKNRVHDVVVGEKAEDFQKFYNRRAELFWGLRTYVDLVSLPEDNDTLDEELTSIKYGWDQRDARIKLQSKDEIKRDLGRSPNDADAFAINFYPEIVLSKTVVHTSANYFASGGLYPRNRGGTGHEPHVGLQIADAFGVGRSNDSFGDTTGDTAGVVGSKRYSPLRTNNNF